MTALHALGLEPREADTHTACRQTLLKEALAPFVDELRLVDCSELFAHVARGQFANLDDIIQSSLELLHEQNNFAFGWDAQVSFAWSDLPVLSLEMEFSAYGVLAFFVLRLDGTSHDVTLRCISFEQPASDPLENTGRLAAALEASQRSGQASDKPPRAL